MASASAPPEPILATCARRQGTPNLSQGWEGCTVEVFPTEKNYMVCAVSDYCCGHDNLYLIHKKIIDKYKKHHSMLLFYNLGLEKLISPTVAHCRFDFVWKLLILLIFFFSKLSIILKSKDSSPWHTDRCLAVFLWRFCALSSDVIMLTWGFVALFFSLVLNVHPVPLLKTKTVLHWISFLVLICPLDKLILVRVWCEVSLKKKKKIWISLPSLNTNSIN